MTERDDLTLLHDVETRLFSAVLSDCCDAVGLRDRVMRPRVGRLSGEGVVAGRALTMLAVDVDVASDNPYELEIAALDAVAPGAVVVAATGPSDRTCVWGELLATAAVARGARGAVIDGYCRDLRQVRKMGFPLWSTGVYPVDSRGRSEVVSFNTPIRVGDVDTAPGDLVVADVDGVVVVPRVHEEAVLALAFAKVSSEDRVRDELLDGALLADVFARHGVL